MQNWNVKYGFFAGDTRTRGPQWKIQYATGECQFEKVQTSGARVALRALYRNVDERKGGGCEIYIWIKPKASPFQFRYPPLSGDQLKFWFIIPFHYFSNSVSQSYIFLEINVCILYIYLIFVFCDPMYFFAYNDTKIKIKKKIKEIKYD